MSISKFIFLTPKIVENLTVAALQLLFSIFPRRAELVSDNHMNLRYVQLDIINWISL